MTRAWLVRLGKYGEGEASALKSGILATGWEFDADMSKASDREEILDFLKHQYADEKKGTLQNWAAQLNQFKNEAIIGDLAVVPLKTTREIAIGRISSDYFQADGSSPARKVEWLRTDLPRPAVKQDLRFSLGASQTVCEISRNNAAERLSALATIGSDPGPVFGNSDLDGPADEVVPDSSLAVDLSDLARQQIEQHIEANFSGHGFTELVAAILRAQGYRTEVSPPGPDRGVDIVAGKGALGFEGPKLVVQVKSGSVVVDQPTLQGLLGCIQDTHADNGLLVSWSGFKDTVRRRVNELYFRVRLWDRDEVLDALFVVYEHLPEEVRADLPLKRLWTLVPDDDVA
ncbi:restriction endonuclease [Glycocaulis sp.]|uniref:restriction endonuclease n=1 Tax=Glycocaulis sp. TaxID=1969725 RepID=UPI003D228B82